MEFHYGTEAAAATGIVVDATSVQIIPTFHTEKITGHQVRIAVTDLGYRGHDYKGEATVYSVRTIPKKSETVAATIVKTEIINRSDHWALKK